LLFAKVNGGLFTRLLGQPTMAEQGELVCYEADGGIVTISLNKPEKLNAFDAQLILALEAALRRFGEDSSALVAILAGNGRAFSTGADVRARQARSREEFERLGRPAGTRSKLGGSSQSFGEVEADRRQRACFGARAWNWVGV
jgi:enoyl-CoA hydratase/carnithine racemase